jgi:hypothetical protein
VIPFERDSNTISATFTPLESELITDLASSIAQLLDNRARSPESDPLFDVVGMGGSDAVSSDPAIARLLPDAYLDDSDSSKEFRQFTERSLASRKIANARVVVNTLEHASGGDVVLDDAAAQSWLRAISDIRLAIAARLGIEHDEDHGSLGGGSAEEESVMLREVYDWLAYVLESLVVAIDVD